MNLQDNKLEPVATGGRRRIKKNVIFRKGARTNTRKPFQIIVLMILVLSMLCPCGRSQRTQNENVDGIAPVEPLSDTPSILPDWSDGEYHDYTATLQLLVEFSTRYPDLVSVFTIGTSVQGRNICCLRITNEKNTTHKYSCLIDGCIHGNEWEGGEACLYLAEFLLINFEKNSTITTMLNTTEVYLIPLVNPDGRQHDDRFDANGIDLNRNFDVNFGRILGRSIPLGRIFGMKLFTWCGLNGTRFVWTNSGRRPFSEPESQAVGRFMESLTTKDFSFYVSCHTAQHNFGTPSYVVIHSDYQLNATEIRVFDYSKSWIENHTEYQTAINQDYFGMGDSMSWCFKEFQIPSFTFEILSKDYEPWFGHGKHDHLVYWMETTLPVFLYLLVNIQNLHEWKTPDRQPPSP
jgi:hypothetical protein